MNNSQFLSEVLDHCYKLKYDETPDYSYIVFLLKKSAMELDLAPGGIFSPNNNIRRLPSVPDEEN